MNHIKTYIIALSIALSSIVGIAQSGISIGNWRTHLPYQKVTSVEVVGNKVFAATPYELFYYDRDDNSLNILNKINTLSDIGISKMRYNTEQRVLFVAYTNANIDLIDDNGDVINMSDIKNKTIIGNKTINNVTFDGHYAYVACGFGIVVFDLSRKEVKDTYYIGANGSNINVTDVAIYGDKIYASTDNGVYYADAESPNLADYSQWSKDHNMIHPNLDYNEMEVFDNKLYLNYMGGHNKDTLFVYDGNSWSYFPHNNYSRRYELRAYDDKFVISNNYDVSIYDKDLVEIYKVYKPGGKSIIPLSTAIDGSGCYWIGDSKRGLIKSDNGFNAEDITPNGPYYKSAFEINACGEHIWVASGGYASNWAKRYLREGLFHFDGQWWESLTMETVPALDTITDIICTATNPSDPSETFVGTWGKGVLRFKDGQLVAHYSTHNSTLSPWLSDPSLVNISGMAFDKKGNLWVANSGANNLLSVMKPDGTWLSFNLGNANSGIDIARLYIDNNDYKWIIKRNGGDGKIIVFNDNGTIDNNSDDQIKVLYNTKGAGGIPGSTVQCMAVDREGAVWVGTNDGPCVFYDTKKIFSSNSYDASQILIPRNDGTNQADPLFKELQITAIAIDGGNNKWFGLESGVYQMSDDCKTQLNYFNTDNSPLLDNTISTMAIDKNGEVFMGTNQGIISYRGTAASGGNTNSEVMAYPNPVRPGYTGFVGIKGVVNDALVKITTADGHFVTKLRADGGQAVWNCCTIDGKKVNPGIYFVFISTDSGTEKLATKILIMN